MSAHHDARVVQLDVHRRTAFIHTEPLPTPIESARRFGRELLAYARVWLHAHRLGYVERAHTDGYVEGYCDGVSANPCRSAE